MNLFGLEQWNAKWETVELTYPVSGHPRLADWLSGRSPGRAVELACGEGKQAIWLATQGWQVTAVDFSAVAVRRARRLAEHHHADVEWVVADVRVHPLPGQVDLAVVCYLHLPAAELPGVIGRAAGALGPGGLLFVLGWDEVNADNGTGGPRPKEALYSPGKLQEAAGDLEVLCGERIARGDGTEAVDTLFVARRAR
jgi:SAM-dependent methyltransferase